MGANDQGYKKWTGHLPKFKGHWAIFEMGVNSFTNVNYSNYATKNFMDVDHNKSMEVNINIFKISFGLQKKENNIGLVTGMGLNFNDYRFSNPYTIKNDNGNIVPVPITDQHLTKTKLSTGYLTVPLLLEFRLPRESGLWVSVGAIGGIKMGSHTKTIINDTTVKDHNDFNISPFRLGGTARIGYKGINLFGTYYFTHKGRGIGHYPDNSHLISGVFSDKLRGNPVNKEKVGRLALHLPCFLLYTFI